MGNNNSQVGEHTAPTQSPAVSKHIAISAPPTRRLAVSKLDKRPASDSELLKSKRDQEQPFYYHNIKRTASLQRRYTPRSASLRRKRSIQRRNLSRGIDHEARRKHRAARRMISIEADIKMVQDQRALLAAAARGDVEAVEAMVDSGIDVNSTDDNQMTPLHHAAMHARDEVIKSLLFRGAEVNAADLKGGFSALHWVVITAEPQFGSTDHVDRSLVALARGGCKLNITDFNFATPLHIAAQKANKVCIKTLIKLGADPDKVDITGRNCIDVAKNQETRKLIKDLKKMKESAIYHVLETTPSPMSSPPTSPAPPPPPRRTNNQQKKNKNKSEHFYHTVELSPPPSYPAPPPPRPSSSSITPPPPPPRRRRQYRHYSKETHIYHVVELTVPSHIKAPPTPPRRRKAVVRKL